MGSYLLVIDGSAGTAAIISTVNQVVRVDAQARFGVLVLLPPPGPDPFWTLQDDQQAAKNLAQLVAAALRHIGAKIISVQASDTNSLRAIKRELRQYPEYSTAIIIARPAMLAGRLKLDLAARLKRRFPRIGVIRVMSRSSDRSPALTSVAGDGARSFADS